MKKLSQKTISKYSALQLAKHLDRCMSHFSEAPYRIDLQYGEVRRLSPERDAYLFDFSIHESNRYALVDAIERAYRLAS